MRSRLYPEPMLIAIDGPAGAGKSTTARNLARELGATYLDSGAMYRCLAVAALDAGLDPDDSTSIGELARRVSIDPGPPATLDGVDVDGRIRSPETSAAASRVSVHPEVREALVARQRELLGSGNWVAEGRDIGTVVAPDADLKIFLIADEATRADRRAEESGESTAEVKKALAERDDRDRSREHGALAPAQDAVRVDTTDLEPAEVVDRILDLARERGLL